MELKTFKNNNIDISKNILSYSNINFIGTSHISKESVKEVETFIELNKPDIVCVELDFQRYQALLSGRKDRISLKNISMVKQIGLTGFIFAYIASLAQKSLGNKVKTDAGSDMMSAIKSAKKNNLKVALIDQDVNKTLSELSKQMKFSEKMRLIFDIIGGLFFGKKAAKKLGLDKFDLRKVPASELVEKLLLQTKTRYPALYKVLVEDRNKFMAKKIFSLSVSNPGSKILAVVGAGHKKEMQELTLLKFQKVKTGKIEII